MRPRSLVVALPLMGLILPRMAPAEALTSKDTLEQFNAVITNNFSSTSDVEGRLVAGTLNNRGSAANFYIMPSPIQAPSQFQAVNALNINNCVNCNINNGGNVNWVTSLGSNNHFNLNGGGSIMHNNPAFAMNEFTAPLNALETRLSKEPRNSSYTFSGSTLTFNLTPTKGVALFDIPVTELRTASNILFSNFSSKDTVIVNVTGAPGFSFNQSGINFNVNCSAPAQPCFNNLAIWNFMNAGSLNLGNWHGSVLAGQANVTNFSPIEGMLYASNFEGRGELHDFPFTGEIPPIPEPSTLVLLATGLTGLAAAVRRKLRL